MNALDEWTARTTAALHRQVCQAAWWSEDCQRPDGGDHARRTMRPAVQAALQTDDPVGALHDRTCSAHLDATTRCPNRDAHVEHMTAQLGRPPVAEAVAS